LAVLELFRSDVDQCYVGARINSA